MRLLAVLLLASLPAHADLYRWVDPESGSVKLSTSPPADPSINAALVPFRHPAAPAPQARLSEILTQLTGASPQGSSRSADGYRQQLEAYEAVRAELDRVDPSGAARRRTESAGVLDRLRQGFAAQFNPAAPGQQK